MADTNKITLVEKLTNIADGFRTSRSLTETLSLDDMATLAAVPITSGDNKFAQMIEGTLTEITAGDLEGLTTIRTYAFTKLLSLISITIPDGITTIESYAFNECYNLVNVILPNTLSSLGERAFYYCNIETLNIPNGITTIPSYCFSYCQYLTSINIPNSVVIIDSNAFNQCSRLTNLTIPSQVNRLLKNALKIGSSSNKATITFLPTTPPTITTDTFDTNKLNKIIVPVGCGEAYRTATNWANFADYIEEAAE